MSARTHALLVVFSAALGIGGCMVAAESEDGPVLESSELKTFDWESLADPFDPASCSGRLLRGSDRESMIEDGRRTTPGEYRVFLRDRTCTVRGTPKPWEAKEECADWNPPTTSVQTVRLEAEKWLFLTIRHRFAERGSVSKGAFYFEGEPRGIRAVFEGLGALHANIDGASYWSEDPSGMRAHYVSEANVGSEAPRTYATDRLRQTIGKGCMRVEVMTENFGRENWDARYSKDKDFEYKAYDFVAYAKFSTAD